jgi:hypothetical protein
MRDRVRFAAANQSWPPALGERNKLLKAADRRAHVDLVVHRSESACVQGVLNIEPAVLVVRMLFVR